MNPLPLVVCVLWVLFCYALLSSITTSSGSSNLRTSDLSTTDQANSSYDSDDSGYGMDTNSSDRREEIFQRFLSEYNLQTGEHSNADESLYIPPSHPIPNLPPVPAWAPFEVNLRFTKRKKLTGCLIEKNMSSVMVAIMCFFDRPKEFKAANRTVTTDPAFDRFCTDNERLSYKAWLEATQIKFEEWNLYTLVRDPIERFVSMFVDKCIMNLKRYEETEDCYGCLGNITCFVEKSYERTMEFAHSDTTKFVVKMEDMHIFPQNWYCNFHDHIQSYKVVKYSSKPHKRRDTYRQLVKIFLNSNVEEELIDEVLRDVTEHNTNHTTTTSTESEIFYREITQNTRLFDLLYAIYYFDYVLFNFPLNFQF